MSQKLGLVPSSRLEERRLVAESLVGSKLCQQGDIVLNRLKAHLGVFALARQPGLVSPDYTVFRPLDGASGKYFERVLRTPAYRGEFRKRTKGIVEGFWRLYTDDFYEIPLPIPERDEQIQIAAFAADCDKRVARLIRAKRRLIALLDEQKQAIIHRAVTRGLNPDVSTRKPSRADWIPQIPETWAECRLRNITSRVTSGSRNWSDYAADTGPIFLRIANLTRDSLELRLDDLVRLNLPDTVEADRARVSPGDILLSITAYIGSVAVVPMALSEAYVSQHLALCRPYPDLCDPRWVGYLLLSQVGLVYGRLRLYGGTKDGLSLDDVKDYPILLPHKSEQAKIAQCIDNVVVKIKLAQEKLRCEINLLEEYRACMIADVVTGKLDVRGTKLSALENNEDLEDLETDERLDEAGIEGGEDEAD